MHAFKWKRFAIGVVLVVSFVLLYGYLVDQGLARDLLDGDKLKAFIQSFGIWGPVAVISFMTLAIVMSPLPSAPIAVAAGALYGHTWGTLYILLGAELGALIAFAVSRLVGYEVLKKWFGDKLSTGIFGSQRHLTLIVFVSRLIPFVSFDVISYAAGLTQITFLRFALATLMGIIPISFLLAHFGSSLGAADPRQVTITLLLLGLVTVVPFIVRKGLAKKSKQDQSVFRKSAGQ